MKTKKTDYLEEDTKLHYYASNLCEHYVSRRYGYGHLCLEPTRLEDPLGIKRCVVKYCPKINKTCKDVAKSNEPVWKKEKISVTITTPYCPKCGTRMKVELCPIVKRNSHWYKCSKCGHKY